MIKSALWLRVKNYLNVSEQEKWCFNIFLQQNRVLLPKNTHICKSFFSDLSRFFRNYLKTSWWRNNTNMRSLLQFWRKYHEKLLNVVDNIKIISNFLLCTRFFVSPYTIYQLLSCPNKHIIIKKLWKSAWLELFQQKCATKAHFYWLEQVTGSAPFICFNLFFSIYWPLTTHLMCNCITVKILKATQILVICLTL